MFWLWVFARAQVPVVSTRGPANYLRNAEDIVLLLFNILHPQKGQGKIFFQQIRAMHTKSEILAEPYRNTYGFLKFHKTKIMLLKHA